MNEYTSGATDLAEPQGNLLGSLPIILWQRRWFLIVPAVLLSIAGLAAAYLLPRTYRSSAVLLVESQDLPGANDGSAQEDPIDRRIAKIRQQILSRPDLVDLIQTYDLYNASSRREPLSKLVEKMRDATIISAVDADIQRSQRANSGSIAFALSFDYKQPSQAQVVAQTFVDRLLKLDATSTRDQAETNVNFLQDQERDLQNQVNQIEGAINRIAGINGAALSSAGAGTIVTGGGVDYSSQIAALQRENATLQSQNSSAIERDSNVVAAETQLAAVKSVYSDDHPDVKMAEKRLAAVRANAKSFQQKGVSALVQQQIAANNTAIARLTQQGGVERARSAAIAAAQSRGPVIAQQVQQLQARAESARANLAKVQSNLLTARSMSKLVDQQRGERLTLIEPPARPDTPTSPNRPLLVAGAVAGGLGVGLALALLIELIARPIRSAGAIARITGAPPLAVVPVLNKRKLRQRRRKAFWQRRRGDAATT